MKPISKTQASLKLDTHNYKITEKNRLTKPNDRMPLSSGPKIVN